MEEPSYETNLHLRPNTTSSSRRRSRDGSLDSLHDIPVSGTEAEKKHVRRVSLLSAEELAPPLLAWPTIILFLVSYTIYWAPIVIFRYDPPRWTIPFQAAAIYALFTPFHDSVHRAISSKQHRWINEVIGHLSGYLFYSPFLAYRYMHLSHHKYTNDPLKDPDMWSSGGASKYPVFLYPLFWMTQGSHNILWYIKSIPTRPFREAIESLVEGACIFLPILYLTFISQQGYLVLHYFLLPNLIATTCLAYGFDFAPHRPHGLTREEDIYQSTNMINGWFTSSSNPTHHQAPTLLSWLLLGQTYHNIHHLYPTIPWFRYKAVWLKHAKELKELGTPITNYLGPLMNSNRRYR